jgi:reactive intermediate/imine deaminase
MSKQIISTTEAPSAIGTYSQAVKTGNTVYLSGQIALDPASMEIVGQDDIDAQIRQVFSNLQAVCKAAGGSFEHIVKLNVFLTDLANFPRVNEIMAEFFTEPYPARAAVGVAALPKGVGVEVDGIMVVE